MATPHFKSYSAVRLREGGFPSIHQIIALSYILFTPAFLKIPIELNLTMQLIFTQYQCFLSQETTFLEQVVEDENQMEATPPGCSRIMNWHLHLEARELVYPKGWLLQKNLDIVLPIE